MQSWPTTDSISALDGGATAPRAERTSASSRLLVVGRIGAVAVLAIGAYFAVREGVAGFYFEKNQPQKIEMAAKWDPGNPQFPSALANLMRFYAENPNPAPIVALCERAVRLSPNNAHYWADLGSAYDSAGRTIDALHALERARQLFPNSPEINWMLANFYVRTGRPNASLPLLRNILLEDGIDETQVFSLATRATNDAELVISGVLPAQAPFLEDYFDFLVTSNNLDGAQKVWERLVESNQPFELYRSLSYVNALIQKPDVEGASRVWSQLIARFPVAMKPRVSPHNLVINGDFALPILNSGFDWRVYPVEGATVSVDPANSDMSGSLQIVFDGSRNLDYAHVLQFVRVEPRTRYRFEGQIRAEGITTDSGARFQVLDANDMAHLFVSSENRIGTSDWWMEKGDFETGPKTRLLIVRVARPASGKIDNHIAGSVWIRHISISAEPG